MNSKIILVSEAPSKESLLDNQYWVGKGGKLLRSCLPKGLTLEDLFYLTDIVKCWPSENENNRKPNKIEISNCSHFLFKEIRIIHPTLIISLGKSSSELLLRRKVKIQNEHGKKHLFNMSGYKDFYMTEQQFAQFLGKSRLYQYLPVEQKKMLPQILITDTQIGLVAKAYYNDENFAISNHQKEISMWNVYNMLTGANKSSYIDSFLERSLNATQLTEGLNRALYGENNYSWFIQ